MTRCGCIAGRSRISIRMRRPKGPASGQGARPRYAPCCATSRDASPIRRTRERLRRVAARVGDRRHDVATDGGPRRGIGLRPRSTTISGFRSRTGDSAAQAGMYHSQYDDFHVDVEVWRLQLRVSCHGARHRRGDGPSAGQRRHRPVRLCRVRAHDAAIRARDRAADREPWLDGLHGGAPRGDRSHGTRSGELRGDARFRPRPHARASPPPRGERRPARGRASAHADRWGCARGPGTATSSTSRTRTTATRTCRSRP